MHSWSQTVDELTSRDVPPRGLGYEAHQGSEDQGNNSPHESQPPPVDVRPDQETDEDTCAKEKHNKKMG